MLSVPNFNWSFPPPVTAVPSQFQIESVVPPVHVAELLSAKLMRALLPFAKSMIELTVNVGARFQAMILPNRHVATEG